MTITPGGIAAAVIARTPSRSLPGLGTSTPATAGFAEMGTAVADTNAREVAP